MSTTRSGESSPATPETMMAGVTQPTIMATTCCRARGRAWLSRGIPSSSKMEALVFDMNGILLDSFVLVMHVYFTQSLRGL